MEIMRLGEGVVSRVWALRFVWPLLVFFGGSAMGQPVLQERSTRAIEGECEFYYSQLLTPGDFLNRRCGECAVESIPCSWTRYHDSLGRRLPAYGCATYRVHCLVRNLGRRQRLGVYVPHVRSSYALWVNGELLGGVGVVSSVPYEARAGVSNTLVPFMLDSGELGHIDTVEVVLQVSNFESPRAGIVEAMRIGDYEVLARELWQSNVWVSLLAGALLMLLAGSLVLYVLRRARKVDLWVSVLLFFVVVAVITSRRSPFLLFFSSTGCDLYYSMRIASRLGCMSAFLMLLRRQYPYEFSGWLAYPLAIFGGLSVLLVSVLPARIYLLAEWVGVVYVIVGFSVAVFWVLLRAMRHQRDLARRIFAGVLLVGLTVLLDFLCVQFWRPVQVSFSLLAVALMTILFTYEIILDISRSLRRMRMLMVEVRNEYQKYRGENGRLAEALRKEQAERARLEEASARQRWSDEGQKSLRKALIENHENLTELCQKSLEEVARYVKSKVGVLYVARFSQAASELVLELYASYGLDESQRKAHATCAIGEGVVGASFLDNTSRVLEDVPKSSININSGLGRSVPRSLVVQPLESDAGLVGVIELGRFAAYEEHEINYLRRCAPQIANSIMHSSSREDSRRQIAQLQSELQDRG